VSEFKVGDKVWVLCKVIGSCENLMKVTGSSDENWFWADQDHCRPVEPEAIEACTKTANDQLRQSLMDYPFGEPANSPKIPDSSSEPIRAAFESAMAKKYDWYQGYFSRNENRYFDSSVEMAWQAFQAGAKYQSSPLTPSPCMDGVDVDQFIDGIMEARGRTSDPVNPSHYKQGAIECIEAIKAALGEGFPDYLRGNAMKYLWRYKEKGGVEDLRKSAWYLDRLIKEAGE